MESALRDERDLQIAAVIKSNLVSDSLTAEQIERITTEMTKDILNVLEDFDYSESTTSYEEIEYVD